MRRELLATPAAIVIGALLMVPLAVLGVHSFWRVEAFEIVRDWNIDNYTTGVRDYGSLLLRTSWTGAIVAAVTVTIAIPMAYACRFKLRRSRHIAVGLVTIALFGGYLVRVYAWKTILGEGGVINYVLLKLGIVSEPLAWLLFSRTAVIITLVNFLLPMAFLPVYAALENVPRARIDASHDLGAGRIATALRLTIPEIAPAIAAGFAICLVLAASDWVTPTLVGGPNSIMAGQVIAGQFGAVYDWPYGSALAILLAAELAVGAALAFGCAALFRRRAGTI